MDVNTIDWDTFDRDGIVSLGRVVGDDVAIALGARADDLATGRFENPHVRLQADTGGEYDDLPEAVTGFVKPGTPYRKVQGLEHDDRFRDVLGLPIVTEICDRTYGAHAGISIFRAMVMNKPAAQGTVLPWHQDGGTVWGLDRDPLVTLWLALDDATPESGCMDVIPGSHRLGLLSTLGSTLAPEAAARHCPPDRVRSLPVARGEMVMFHNWLIHRSGVNHSRLPRRAFTTCLMDSRTISVSTGQRFQLLRGDAPPAAYRFVEQMEIDTAFLRDTAARSEEYALSLAAEVERLRAELAARDA